MEFGNIALPTNFDISEAVAKSIADQFNPVNLPEVKDPDKVYADITRQEYIDYVRNFRDTEEDLINRSQTDTSLIDQAREDASTSSALTAGIAQRNRERYGGQLTGAQSRELNRTTQRRSTLGGIDAINNARIAQDDTNRKLMSDLINIGQGVNRTAQNQLGSSAASAVQARQAYDNALASYRQNRSQTMGNMATAAILAFAL